MWIVRSHISAIYLSKKTDPLQAIFQRSLLFYYSVNVLVAFGR